MKALGTPAGNLAWLFVSRALRSFITAFLTVIFPLYLAAEGYSAARIGLVLAVSAAMTVLLVTFVGVLADRVGRRPTLMVLASLSAVGALAMMLSRSFLVVALASGLGGVGKGGGAGSGGSWGPVFPAEQPLVAASATPQGRTRAFGQLAFVGVMAGAVGSLVASVPELLHRHGWTWLAAYRVLFALAAGLSVVMVLTLLPIRERPPARGGHPAPPLPTWDLVRRLGVTNALNGLGMGFLGPLLTYWFYRRYGVGPAPLGVLYTVVNLAAAVPYLGSAWLTARLGAVRTVTVTRAASLLALALMPWMPTFAGAGACYAARMVFQSMGMPARQSFVMGVSDPRYQSRVAALSSLPSQAMSMVSPALAGLLMDAVPDIPIYGAVFFFAANLVSYYLAFRHVRPPEEEQSAV